MTEANLRAMLRERIERKVAAWVIVGAVVFSFWITSNLHDYGWSLGALIGIAVTISTVIKMYQMIKRDNSEPGPSTSHWADENELFTRGD